MPFKSEDIYTASGNAKLFNAWTPYVSKFDTSSFYNWEQDNLPLYDLEERTYEIWEQQGWPTSSVPGLALTVSADADAASLASESTLFTDVSSAIAAIPKVVRFPVLVEVGSFDELGPLELHNFRIEEGGSIEVINRNFSRFYNTSAIARSSLPSPAYNATHALFQQVSSIDLENTLTDTSCVHLGIPVFSSISDVRFNGASVKKGGSFAYPKFFNKEGVLAVSIDEAYRAATNSYAALSYEEGAATTHSDSTLPTYDISATSDSDSTDVLTRTQIAANDPITGNLYANDLTKISVKNCDGPIYIRNFFVNGTRNNPDYGIEITNSDVVLENCSVARAKRAGFKFNNSKVVLSRSAFSYRNYNLLTASTREEKVGTGFHAVNSEVTVSSNIAAAGASDGAKDYGASGNDAAFVASRNYAGFVLDNSKLIGGFGRTTITQPETGGIIAAEANTGPGFLLNNSEINVSGLVESYFNDVGVESHNSILRTQNFCAESQQAEGYLGRNSEFMFYSDISPTVAGEGDRAQMQFYRNRQHVVAKNNTNFDFEVKDSVPSKYATSLFASSHGSEIWGAAGDSAEGRNPLPSIAVDGNSDLSLIHPKLTVNSTEGATVYGSVLKASRNSSAKLFGSKEACTFIASPLAEQNVAALYANNSEISLHGPTVIGNFGVDLLVDNNSTLNITPPVLKDEIGYAASAFDLGDDENHTSVELHSTRSCIVADNNSTVNLKDLGDFEANWGRGTIGSEVIDDGTDLFERESNASGLIYKGSLQFYPNPSDDTIITDNSLGAVSNLLNNLGLFTRPVFSDKTYINTFLVKDEVVNGAHNTASRGLISKGGVCLRALGDSVVNVFNVHFPSGNEGGSLDGVYYNASGSDCDRLMIWNIADTSRLNASYLSVSGLYPTDAAYHGPSALWVSSSVQGTNDPTYVIASGAPIGTPDTGRLSVLDAFGAGSSLQWGTTSGIDVNSPFDRALPAQLVGASETYRSQSVDLGLTVSSTESLFYGMDGSSANTGPFRIYWSVSPAAKVLATDMSGYAYGGNNIANFSGAVGPAYQIFAQGYNLSAEASALNLVGGSNASSIYPQLLKFSRDTDNDGLPNAYATSGFYYCSEFVEDNPNQCMLDESAAATFANSKNASLGSSGRPKKVTVYKAESDAATNRGSEAYQGDSEATIGFRSANTFDLRREN